MNESTRTFDRRPRWRDVACACPGAVMQYVCAVRVPRRDGSCHKPALSNVLLHMDESSPSLDRLRPRLLGIAPGTAPDRQLQLADDVSAAFLALFERLEPQARVAFLLREAFDAGYDEVALAIGKSETACRRIVRRAKTQLHDERPR
jgi:DNA-directed RNA polymerase specialized sigma24 family protein